MEQNLLFLEGWGLQLKKPFLGGKGEGEVWRFSGTKHSWTNTLVTFTTHTVYLEKGKR